MAPIETQQTPGVKRFEVKEGEKLT